MRNRAIATIALSLLVSSAFAATYVVPPDDKLIGKADAIVIARALESFVHEVEGRGIETVTVFAIEEVLKGKNSIASGFSIRIPGGVIEKDGEPARFKIIPGAPRFVDGEKVLLFVSETEDGSYTTTDFALGLFGFATDEDGHRVLIRAESEINGWDLDGNVHREKRRDADRFLAYIRDVVRGKPVEKNYFIDSKGIVGQSGSVKATIHGFTPETQACPCTATSYTLANAETDMGFRWNSFPSQVNWNRGNTCSGASNGGSDAIDAANNAWNGDANSNVNFVRTSATSNTNGINEDADGVNNVVFEKDFGSPYSCSSGGLLGVGGINSAVGTHSFNSETFFSTTEGDVSMNLGVCACVGAQLSVTNFNNAVTHEIGHALGFRHSDKSRDNAQPCGNFSNYDCAATAIMTAVLPNGLSGLQTWDTNAVRKLYASAPGLGAPTNVVATTQTGSTSVTITWDASPGADGSTTYEVHRSLPNNFNSFSVVSGCSAVTNASRTCNDTSTSSGSAYLYKVRAGSGGTFSATDLATAVAFTDDALTVGTSIKAAHITQLRTAVNAVQTLAGQGTSAYTDDTITVGSTTAKAAHITELRSRLQTARTTLGFSTSFAESITQFVTTIKASHITELRNFVK